LLASSGRPLSQIAQELGIAPSRLSAWRNRGDGGHAGSPRRPNTLAAIPLAGADLAAENARLRHENERLRMEREILKKRCAFSRKRRDEIPPHRGSAGNVPGSRHVRCDGRLSGGVLCLAWQDRKSAQGGQSRLADRDPARPYRASRSVLCAQIHAALRAERHTASRGRVERLMCHHGIRAITPRRFRVCTTGSHHDLPRPQPARPEIRRRAADENIGVDAALADDHEPHVAARGDCGNQAHAMAGAGRLNDRGVAFRPPCAPRVMTGAYVRRVTEIDAGLLFLGHRLDLRAFFLKPLPNQRLIVFDRSMQWLLAGDAKLRQQPADGIGGQRDVEFPLDQRRHDRARPQCKRELQLQWVLLRHRVVIPTALGNDRCPVSCGN